MTGPPVGIEKVIYSQSKGRTNCPSCGRYVGPLEICPYCRAIHRKRPVIFWFKYLSPVLAIAGMFLLQYLGDTLGNPLVKIGDLGRTSNFAYVQLEGTVCGEPRFYHVAGTDDPTAGTMEFCLDDGTGQTRVKTYEDATRRILRQRKVPSPGDTVRVTGNYQVRTHKNSIIVGSPHELDIRPSPVTAELTAEALAWAEREALVQDGRVVVTGKVKFNWNDREKGKYTAVMNLDAGDQKDKNGRRRYLRVEIPWNRLEMDGTIPRHAPKWEGMPPQGATVRITGAARYVKRGKHPGWRVYPGWSTDIETLDAPAAAKEAGDASN